MKLPISFILGLGLCSVFLFAAMVSFFWTPHETQVLDISSKLKMPNLKHIFGTDHFGRDILSMVMVGARTSILVAIIALLIGLFIGVPLGLLAAIKNNSVIDDLVMRTNDLIFAFPSLVIAILITAIFGSSAFNAILAIGIFNIPVFARLTRGSALSILSLDYVSAAKVSGKGSFQICIEHIIPNIMNLLIVQGSIQFSLGILAESGLSYIGLGVQPPTPSWGRMLSESQTMIYFAPHTALFPGFAIILTVLGINLMGDGLRDYLDPRLKDHKR